MKQEVEGGDCGSEGCPPKGPGSWCMLGVEHPHPHPSDPRGQILLNIGPEVDGLGRIVQCRVFGVGSRDVSPFSSPFTLFWFWTPVIKVPQRPLVGDSE